MWLIILAGYEQQLPLSIKIYAQGQSWRTLTWDRRRTQTQTLPTQNADQ